MGKHFYGEELKAVGVESMDVDCSVDKDGGFTSKVTGFGDDGRKTVLEGHGTADGKVNAGIVRTYDSKGVEIGSINLDGTKTGVFVTEKPSVVADGIKVLKDATLGAKSQGLCSLKP